MTTTTTTTTANATERLTGRVKWFNNKAGYGFITAADGATPGADIFVHHTSIRVDAQQYKYLVLGEYVEFGLSAVSNGTHEIHAADVSGIKGGKLMCETRHEMLATRPAYKTSQGTSQEESYQIHTKKPRQQAPPTAGRGTTTGGRGTTTGGRGRGRGATTGGRGRGATTGGRG
jgi:cold shock CspA family protein